MEPTHIADYALAHERQELGSRQTRERVARLHLYLQGGTVQSTDDDREWVRDWFPDLYALMAVRAEKGSIPPSSEYHLERARRFIAGDLDALTDEARRQFNANLLEDDDAD